MAKRSTRKEMVILLVVYAAVMVVLGLDKIVDHFDNELLDVSLDLIIVILFAVAAIFMFTGKLIGYYSMILALAIQAVLALLGILSGLSSVTVNEIATALALVTINLFIIIWLLQGENKILFK